MRFVAAMSTLAGRFLGSSPDDETQRAIEADLADPRARPVASLKPETRGVEH